MAENSEEILAFIYGILRRDGTRHDLMDGAVYLGKARTRGTLYHIDEYPGLVLDGNDEVRGELFVIDEALAQRLDEYEGCFESPPLYVREKISVLDESGEVRTACSYVFQQLSTEHEVIASGDWIKWLGER